MAYISIPATITTNGTTSNTTIQMSSAIWAKVTQAIWANLVKDVEKIFDQNVDIQLTHESEVE